MKSGECENSPMPGNWEAGSAQARHNGDGREASDQYRGEIVRFGGWRVAVCRNDLQWLLQRRMRNGGPDVARWEAVGFCLTRAALLRLWRAATGDDGACLKQLLPERCDKAAD